MLSGIIAFLGGSAFRMIWGEVSSYFKAKQDHVQEMDRVRLQGEMEALRHTRDLELMNRSHELGIEKIQVRSETEVNEEDARAFTAAMQNFGKPTGISWVDAWNAAVRPSFATICLVIWVLHLNSKGWLIDDFDRHLVAVIVGFFFADRTLKKYGK